MGIESFKKDYGIVILQLFGGDRERFFEIPILLFGPLYLLFIRAVIRIG